VVKPVMLFIYMYACNNIIIIFTNGSRCRVPIICYAQNAKFPIYYIASLAIDYKQNFNRNMAKNFNSQHLIIFYPHPFWLSTPPIRSILDRHWYLCKLGILNQIHKSNFNEIFFCYDDVIFSFGIKTVTPIFKVKIWG